MKNIVIEEVKSEDDFEDVIYLRSNLLTDGASKKHYDLFCDLVFSACYRYSNSAKTGFRVSLRKIKLSVELSPEFSERVSFVINKIIEIEETVEDFERGVEDTAALKGGLKNFVDTNIKAEKNRKSSEKRKGTETVRACSVQDAPVKNGHIWIISANRNFSDLNGRPWMPKTSLMNFTKSNKNEKHLEAINITALTQVKDIIIEKEIESSVFKSLSRKKMALCRAAFLGILNGETLDSVVGGRKDFSWVHLCKESHNL